MGILRDFERRLEGAVEGFFARAFRSGLQPVELAKALQRYAQSYQQVGVDGVFVPNAYRFSLSPQDYERFSGFADSLRGELAAVVKRTAAERGWRLQGPARIELREDPQVKLGTYELRGKVESAEPSSRQAAPAPPRPRPTPAPTPRRPPVPAAGASPADAGDADRTSVLPRPRQQARAFLVVSGDRQAPHAVVDDATIGRLPECEVTLDDSSVSRRHARVTFRDSAWTVTDLGSTNGTKVNGQRVEEATLSDGDRLELGSVRLVFALER